MDAPEALTFQCDHCGSALTVPRSLAGVTGPCPECGLKITSPSVEPSPEEIWNQAKEFSSDPEVESVDDLTRFFEEDSLPAPSLGGAGRVKHVKSEKKSNGKVVVGMLLGAGLAVGTWFAFPHVKTLLPQGGEKQNGIETTTDSQSQPPPAPEVEAPSDLEENSADPIEAKEEEDVVESPNAGEETERAAEQELSDLDEEIGNEFPTSGPGSALEEPRNFLLSYLTSKYWENLVPSSINGSKLKAAMADYYGKNPYQPEEVVEIAFQHKQKLPGRDDTFYLFKVITESNLDSFPMTVEETEDGLKTDWETFVQFKDSHLQKFIDNPTVDGKVKTFNVILKRQHYFRNDVPDTESKWCFSIEAPIQNQEGGAVFVSKDGLRADEFDREIKWNYTYFLIVELKWVVEKEHKNKPYIQLMQIKQFNWRGHDPDFASQPS